jgi:predicted HTH transcriptional regulator
MPDLTQMTERLSISSALLSDINLNLVRDHIDTAIKRRGYDGPTEPEEYLIEHSCLIRDDSGALTPTLAGIVAFGREPHRHVSVCGIDIAQFSGPRPNTTDLVLSRQIRGDLMSIIDRSVDLLWARCEHRTHIIGTERVEEHAYPLVVLRELTVNAVVHRDWSYGGTYIRIQMFPDRIEWISPGGFPGRAPNGVSLETLLHAQVSRNPALAQILYHSGRVESFGMGIDTTLVALQELGCRTPEVYDNGDIFLFRVWGKRLAEIETTRPSSLTSRQRRIVATLTARGSCSSADLQDTLDENVRNIQRDLRELIAQGIIVAEGATSNRTYRLVR